MEIGVYYRDYRSLCGISYLNIVEFLDNQKHEMQLSLEPVGQVTCEVRKHFVRYFYILLDPPTCEVGAIDSLRSVYSVCLFGDLILGFIYLPKFLF